LYIIFNAKKSTHTKIHLNGEIIHQTQIIIIIVAQSLLGIGLPLEGGGGGVAAPASFLKAVLKLFFTTSIFYGKD
jgi:hypothetical protein